MNNSETGTHSDISEPENFDIRQFFKRWPGLYYLIVKVFGPVLFIGLSTNKFLKKYSTSGTILNLGSGPHKLSNDNITNVDMHPYEGVDIVADISNVPLPDGSVSRIVSNTVYEHLKDPQKVTAEIHRLLEKDGLAYLTIPFIYPFHSSPSDYYRWTDQGLRELFKDFEVVELGVRSGPFSALDAFLCHLVGEVFSFGSPTINSLLTNVSIFIFFPIKFLDYLFLILPSPKSVACIFYLVVKK